MEPTAEVRTALEIRLNSAMKKIPAHISVMNSMRKKVPIDSLQDFVFGMVYQDYFQKCVDYNVKYTYKHADTTTENNFLDLAGIGLDVFETQAESILKLIENKLNQQTETSPN